MNKKGFTLIEVLIGLCLLGLISVMILPTISNTSKSSNKNFEKMEMIYLGEMVIENLKAFKYDNCVPAYVCNTEIKEIIDLFNLEKTSNFKLTFKGEYADYKILIEKKEQSSILWEIIISIDYLKEGGKKGVKYKAFLPSN